MSTHNICFCGEIREILILFRKKKSTLCGALTHPLLYSVKQDNFRHHIGDIHYSTNV